MKPFQVSPIQSKASFALVNVRTFSNFSVLLHSNRSSLSVCGICRISQPNKAVTNNLIFLAMTNSCCSSRFHSICHKAGGRLALGRRYLVGSFRTFSTSSASLLSATGSPVVRGPSSLVLTSCIPQSDAPQRSDEWFALRRDKLTTSTFSTALGFWQGKRRHELWHEKVFASEIQVMESARIRAMEWGVLNEAAAVDSYKSITGREVSHLGFAIHSAEQFDWLGASPDGLLGCFQEGGILEVKCPFNKGKPETALPWSAMPFYYMPQVQGQLEIMNREWADLYCWTPNGSTIFRVHRNREYWELIHGILREFWWENVIPAREALLLGKEEEAEKYQPTSIHNKTKLVIFKSSKLASESKMFCREIAGHIEFYR